MGQWDNYKCPPSEQNYSDDINYGDNMEPSEEELADLSKACNRLWELDLNRLVPGKDYQIDCGEGKKVYQKEDVAEGSLFSWLSKDVFRGLLFLVSVLFWIITRSCHISREARRRTIYTRD